MKMTASMNHPAKIIYNDSTSICKYLPHHDQYLHQIVLLLLRVRRPVNFMKFTLLYSDPFLHI